MKKLLTYLLKLFGVIFVSVILFILIDSNGSAKKQEKERLAKQVTIAIPNTNRQFSLYDNHHFVEYYSNIYKAKKRAVQFENAHIIDEFTGKWVYSSYKTYRVFSGNRYLEDFSDIQEAYDYAKLIKEGKIYIEEQLVWKRDLEKEHALPIGDITSIKQYPELPRGCEVTALAMLMNYLESPVNKLVLAEKIDKEVARYFDTQEQQWFYGNPHKGFVGNMYDLNEEGYGVYHDPIAHLARQYFENQVIDFTGEDFSVVENMIYNGLPVWVVTNTTYDKLPQKYLFYWKTKYGNILITPKEHAVLIHNVDDEFVYFKDPLQRKTKAPKKDFIESWEQLGSQSITIISK